MQIVASEFATFDIADSKVVPGERTPHTSNLIDPVSALRAALDAPWHFPPLRRALTPDDHLAVVIDDRLPMLAELAPALLNYLSEAGVNPEAITLVSPPGSRQEWVNDLPDTLQDVRTEIHDPADRRHLSYLASTRKGRRIYLNRTLVDADQTIVLSGNRYDSQFGRRGGAAELFPQLSDRETIDAAANALSLHSEDEGDWPLRAEAEEVAWLLGVPFLVQVIDGSAHGIYGIVAGTVEAAAECDRLLDERWRVPFGRRAELVVATLSGDPKRQDFAALAHAALCAARVVEPEGRVVILSRAKPTLGDGAVMMRDIDNPILATRLVREIHTPDRAAVLQWLDAARRANLYLLADLPEEIIESMFATPLQQPRQAQRLIDAAGSVLLLEDADKALAVLTPGKGS
jgi:nickel-dependent lactate racemase